MSDKPTICVDIDGTITTNPLHIGGFSWWGYALWWLLRVTGLADVIMRRARPNPAAITWLRAFADMGWHVRLVTAREERYWDLTHEWLRENRLGWAHDLRMRPPGQSSVGHKAYWTSKRKGCLLYLEDQLEIAEEVQKLLGRDAPIILHMTSWELLAPVLRMVLAEAKRELLPG